ncbi:NAD-dependent epimerase/dehydratase family protein [Enhygromyxa salina]|uniref:dTDP-glucose 4,6-dehydratase n=1 Tax=Enhygromyxa salina TaxID=215803 RepID=A0A2S9YR23_9BACT|nr:NAD-dependent epimerase/dehydratase family protein [Enhygromyxa salina]PRQ07547.1 dTDP-glucose 4,6-dehydratase [Enhygromyxa salina]
MSAVVLVTGSDGFLGRSVCAELHRVGYTVRPYDLRVGGDILDADQLRRALAGCGACLHLAAIADLHHAEADPERCELVNVEGTRRVAAACREAGARLLYASTCCVYGNNGLARCDEAAPPAPTELYARTKLAGEAFMPPGAAVLRLATFYGPGMRESLATSVFLRRALAGQTIDIHGDGQQTRCYTHVDDVARGIVTVFASPARPRCVNVASDYACSVLELARLAQQAVGAEVQLRLVDDRPGQIRHSAIDSTLLRSLGWAPRWSLAEGMRACVAALREARR